MQLFITYNIDKHISINYIIYSNLLNTKEIIIVVDCFFVRQNQIYKPNLNCNI